MYVMLWWSPSLICNPIFSPFFDNRKWVYQRYFSQGDRHEALFPSLLKERELWTNSIHVVTKLESLN